MSESSTQSEGALLEGPDQALSTLDSSGERRWLYPTPSRGNFWWARLAIGWGLIALFTALPIVEIGGKPAVFLDIIHRRFVIFGTTFHATDTVYLMLLLLSVLLTIGLLTALLGRVWCGWGCPQTVYLEFVFRPIERLIEGPENQRRNRDQGPWRFDKIWRKGLKHTLYAAVALGLAHTFVAYFVSWDRLIAWMTGPPTEHWGFFFMMAFTTGLILFDFAYFREQMCVTICPYAKLQSVMMDRDSLIVSYDPNRGEPRGRRSREQRKKEKEGVELDLGDCIDCGACVRTCPTGIDIRDGLQLECVSCTQCIDACNDIMDKVDKPRGLIRYTSENALEGEETNILRPRVILYSALLLLAAGTLGVLLTSSQPLEVDLRRAPGAAFTRLENAGGQIANHIQFRVRNKTAAPVSYTVEAVEPEAMSLKMIGPASVEVPAGEMKRISAWALLPASAFDQGSAPAKFAVIGDGKKLREVSMSMLGPDKPGDNEPDREE